MATVRYATLYYPGVFMAEEKTVRVSPRTTGRQMLARNPEAFKVSFYTRTERKVRDEMLTGDVRWERKSYIAGEYLSLAEMKRTLDPKRDEILISNVECNGYKGAIRCRTGNWQFKDDDVEVIDV